MYSFHSAFLGIELGEKKSTPPKNYLAKLFVSLELNASNFKTQPQSAQSRAGAYVDFQITLLVHCFAVCVLNTNNQ